jgi:hypothetical protein
MSHGRARRLMQAVVTVGLLLAFAAAAQEDRGRARVRISAMDLKTVRTPARVRISAMDLKTVRTPQFRDTSNPAAASEYEWLQIYLEYETEGARKGWADDVTIEWAVLARPANGKPILLQETASYVDVPDGKHHAVMYVRPGFIHKYCETRSPNKSLFASYVEISVDGQRLARQEYSRANQPKNWWRAKEPDVRLIDGELMLPEDTPFAHMDYDFYEHPKRKRQ